MSAIYGPTGSATSAYVGHYAYPTSNRCEHFNPGRGNHLQPCAKTCFGKLRRFGDLAEYYRVTIYFGSRLLENANVAKFNLSEGTRQRVEAGILSNGTWWDEWSLAFMTCTPLLRRSERRAHSASLPPQWAGGGKPKSAFMAEAMREQSRSRRPSTANISN